MFRKISMRSGSVIISADVEEITALAHCVYRGGRLAVACRSNIKIWLDGNQGTPIALCSRFIALISLSTLGPWKIWATYVPSNPNDRVVGMAFMSDRSLLIAYEESGLL